MRRAIELLKPGGWLLVEDPDDENMMDNANPLGPGMTSFLQGWMSFLREHEADPSFGRQLRRIVESTQAFSEIHVRKVTVPISGKSDGKASLRILMI